MHAYPFLFNVLKHHLKTIKELIVLQKINLATDITIIGNSLTDLYIGQKDTHTIFTEIFNYLNNYNVFIKKHFTQWVSQNNGYRIVSISDQSKWILRLSNDNAEQYIHIHPSRNSEHTLRVKSETLKTAIAFAYINRNHVNLNETLHLEFGKEGLFINTYNINQIRKYFNLSPVKSIERCVTMLHLLYILNNPIS